MSDATSQGAPQQIVKALPARPLDDVLADCASAQQRAARGDAIAVPRVTLHLASGRDLEGEVNELQTDRRGHTTLVLTVAPFRGDSGAAVTYVPLGSIEAVSVHEALRHGELLSQGQVSAPAGAAPTRLEARRRLEQHRQETNAALGLALGWSANVDEAADGEPLRGLVDLSSDAAATLKAVASDAVGRTALAQGVTSVALAWGAEATVSLSEGRLAFVAPWALGRRGRMALKDLKEAVEALL